jgi:small-conductance mechanosensitive channel
MHDILDQVYYSNSVRDYIQALVVIIAGIVIIEIIKQVIARAMKRWGDRTSQKWDDFISESVTKYAMPFLRWAIIYSGIHLLWLSERTSWIIDIVISIILTYFAVRFVSSLIMLLIRGELRRRQYGEEKLRQLGGLLLIINGIIWFLGLVLLLGNWGVEITPIIAGLGIGGIAVALAAQNILGDLFSYFAIFFDRPFEAGDFIIVDDKLGTVEYVGIKTTQIRSLSGEQLIIGNANLTNARIHNYKRMQRRRVVFQVNVEYSTPAEKVKEISPLLRSIVEQQQRVTFDRAHLASFSDWGLRYEVVYYVLSPDYNIYMDIQQNINFQIYDAFVERGIRFGVPANNIFVKEFPAATTSPGAP